jgi:hypothetical protein
MKQRLRTGLQHSRCDRTHGIVRWAREVLRRVGLGGRLAEIPSAVQVHNRELLSVQLADRGAGDSTTNLMLDPTTIS